MDAYNSDTKPCVFHLYPQKSRESELASGYHWRMFFFEKRIVYPNLGVGFSPEKIFAGIPQRYKTCFRLKLKDIATVAFGNVTLKYVLILPCFVNKINQSTFNKCNSTRPKLNGTK